MILGHTVQDLVNDESQESLGKRMLITDQVATAPCTDCIQARRATFEAKPHGLGCMCRLGVFEPLNVIRGIRRFV